MAPPLGLRRSLIERKMAECGLKRADLAAKLGVDRSQATRWLKPDFTFPKQPEQITALLRVLDLDPVLLFDFSPRSYFALRAAVNMAAWKGSFGLFDGAFRFLDPLLTEHLEAWPPPTVNEWYAPRAWTLRTEVHDPTHGRVDTFPGFVLASTTNPQVWHFAWRPARTSPGATWRAYGFVLRLDDRLELYHFDGSTSVAKVDAARGEVAVETWFGAGGAEFGVTSLHDFQMRVENAAPEGLPVVRFG